MNEHLDRSTEARLIAIGNKRYYKAVTFTIVWSVIIGTFWLAFMLLGNRSFTLIANYLPLLLCFFPFFFTYKTLFSKTFYATVDHKTDYTQFQQLKEAYVHNRFDTVEALSVKFKKDNGKDLTIVYKKKNYVLEGIHYNDSDRVLFVRGLKYPIKFPITDTEERTCPICGRTIHIGYAECPRCKFDYSELSIMQ